MSPRPRIIFGIDPGFGRMGYGIIETTNGSVQYRAADCIQTPKTMAHSKRLQHVWRELCALIEKHQPDVLAMERLFFAKNAKTALAVAEMRGVALLAAEEHRIPIVEFTPLEVKVALSGYGKADKKQIAYMVVKILNIPKTPTLDDTTDALAVAVCAAHHSDRLAAM